ncbi:hypothetical protein P4234_26800 [Pseudomonas aeruginosa]|nr:hypothetical protein [Pseudomonas aeruginosa]
MKQAIIVGEGRALERADSTARERGLEHRVLELNAADRHSILRLCSNATPLRKAKYSWRWTSGR